MKRNFLRAVVIGVHGRSGRLLLGANSLKVKKQSNALTISRPMIGGLTIHSCHRPTLNALGLQAFTAVRVTTTRRCSR